MANTGGGWIVIGYRDKPLQVDPNISQGIAATYDSTVLSNAVDKVIHGDHPIRLSVYMESHPSTQQVFPIIEIKGFQRSPYICKSTKIADKKDKAILRSGKVYIRRAGAATSEIHTPAEWEDLLKRCVAHRRDEFLSEFASLLHRMSVGDATPINDLSTILDEWMGGNWSESATQHQLSHEGGYMEAGCMLSGSSHLEWSVQDLREATILAKPLYHDYLTAKQNGIEARLGQLNRSQYWHLNKSGSSYSSLAFVDDQGQPSFSIDDGHPTRALWFDFAIYRIVSALTLSARLYRSLNVAPDEPYLMCIKHGGLQRRTIYAYDYHYPYYVHLDRVCNESNAAWVDEVTQDLVNTQLAELTYRIANSLFVLFEFTEVHINVVREIVQRKLERNDT